ncbi:MAG: UDP-N-acetylmuramoyl-tripeptide--D-alanyl-D-alanine ligase [Ruminococcus sp.]|nr:UDP-N-acetylmuramoyl-tripeptide--D-alanyl-D-alanine ligase [Ruminococcus sp.]
MLNGLFICATVAFAACFALSIIDSMHFFQLNSYRFDTHTKWMKENFSKYLSHMMLAVLMLIVALLSMRVEIKAVLFIVLFAIGCLVEKPKKAKKPLVYTARVKRMLVTTTIIVFAAALVSNLLCFRDNRQSIILTVYACLYLASPAMVLLANLINKPIELSINRGYTNDAKRILAQCPDLTIIGVTGSYGKTSVKYYLNTLLRAKYNVLMTPESYNTPMGVVKTIRGSLKATDEIFICEMGAKWVGDIKELCDIVHPQHGIITSIGPQHLESFKTLDAVKNTKFELADSLPDGGMLFLNGDDENIKDHGTNRPAFTYSIGGDADYTAFDVAVSDRGTTFSVKAPNGETEKYTTRLIGRHNVLNIVGAIAVSHQLGISLAELKGQVRKLEGVPHRLELSEKNGVTIIDDAYNSNPSGTKAALEALSLFDGYKILVTPGMVELGEKQDELNREFGRNAASVCDYVVLVGQKQAVPIKAGLLDEKYDENKIFVANTINEALAHVYALHSAGRKKIILLENDLPDNY